MRKTQLQCYREWWWEKFGFKNPMDEPKKGLSSRQKWLNRNRKIN